MRHKYKYHRVQTEEEGTHVKSPKKNSTKKGSRVCSQVNKKTKVLSIFFFFFLILLAFYFWWGVHDEFSNLDTEFVSRWYTDECRAFYSPPPSINGPFFSQIKSLEDFCPNGGRMGAFVQDIDQMEINIISELNLAYVDNRKAATVALRFIKSFQKSLILQCDNEGPEFQYCCTKIYGKCRYATPCLSETQLENLYFFTFVRDPVERFYSSFKQYMNTFRIDTITCDDMWDVLYKMKNHTCGVDEHFMSQSFSLSSPILKDPTGPLLQVPMNFIGKFENLTSEFMHLLEIAELRKNVTISQKRKERVTQILTKKTNSSPGKVKTQILQCRTENMDAIVSEIYGQDIKCFGYGN